MPRKRRLAKRRKLIELTTQHFYQLRTGNDFFDDAFGRNPNLRLMREAWEKHRENILTQWIAANPGTRPWAWWKFDAPEPRPEGEGEADYLGRLGLLTDLEK